MSFIFVSSSSGGDIPVGTIILWYGTYATIPAGWAYYAAAAGMWVKGATTVNTTPQNNTGHVHNYTNPTGSGGNHTHSFTASNSSAINAEVLNSSGETLRSATMTTHYHSTTTVGTVGADAGHTHNVNATGTKLVEPESVGIYYIRRSA